MHEGYLKLKMPDHPLATKTGFVYAHRVALYEVLGPGEHPCFACGRLVSWSLSYPRTLRGLVVDHIDHDRLNNDPSNLRPSCGPCNVNR